MFRLTVLLYFLVYVYLGTLTTFGVAGNKEKLVTVKDKFKLPSDDLMPFVGCKLLCFFFLIYYLCILMLMSQPGNELGKIFVVASVSLVSISQILSNLSKVLGVLHLFGSSFSHFTCLLYFLYLKNMLFYISPNFFTLLLNQFIKISEHLIIPTHEDSQSSGGHIG